MPVKLFDWLIDPYLSSNHEEAMVALLFWTNQFNSIQWSFISVQEDSLLTKKIYKSRCKMKQQKITEQSF